MDKLSAIAGFGCGKTSQPLWHWLIVLLIFALISIPASKAVADESNDSPPPGVGSLQDYLHEGEPPGHVYTPSSRNAPPEGPGLYGGSGYGPSASYGTPSSTEIATGAAVVGALMVAAWAYQQYRAHQQEQRAMRRYRRHLRHRPLPPPPAYGF